MRIADHAVAMQSSQSLQQPSHTTHHQQVVSPEAARAAAEAQAKQHAKQVNESEKTENRTIRDQEREKGSRQNLESESDARMESETNPAQGPGASEPGKGEQLDLMA